MEKQKNFIMKYTKKNEDVRKILEEDKTIKKSEYVSNSIRFYNKYKTKLNEIDEALEFYNKYKDTINNNSNINLNEIEKLIDKKLEMKIKELKEIERNLPVKEESKLKKLEELEINNSLYDED